MIEGEARHDDARSARDGSDLKHRRRAGCQQADGVTVADPHAIARGGSGVRAQLAGFERGERRRLDRRIDAATRWMLNCPLVEMMAEVPGGVTTGPGTGAAPPPANTEAATVGTTIGAWAAEDDPTAALTGSGLTDATMLAGPMGRVDGWVFTGGGGSIAMPKNVSIGPRLVQPSARPQVAMTARPERA